jgi:chromosome segregation ATPase
VTTDEKIERLAENLENLTGVVTSLASTVVAHDNQIEQLIKVAEIQRDESARTNAKIADLRDHMEALYQNMAALSQTVTALSQAVANTERQWQAYLLTLPRQ